MNDRDLETDSTGDAKSCQLTCDEQFLTLRERAYNFHPIEHFLQYQAKELMQYVKEGDFELSDFADEKMTLLIGMLIDWRDVYTQHKLDVGETRQKFKVTLKTNVELKKQRPSKVSLHLEEKWRNL